MNTTAINWSDTETVQPASSCNEFAREVKLFTINYSLFTPTAIYRKQLKMYRRMAQVIDRHAFAVNTSLWLAGIATAIYTFLFY